MQQCTYRYVFVHEAVPFCVSSANVVGNYECDNLVCCQKKITGCRLQYVAPWPKVWICLHLLSLPAPHPHLSLLVSMVW